MLGIYSVSVSVNKLSILLIVESFKKLTDIVTLWFNISENLNIDIFGFNNMSSFIYDIAVPLNISEII